MIKDTDISVLVQGPVIEKVTGTCLERIKELLPNCQLIFSTCSTSTETQNLRCDQLIHCKDPGAEKQSWHRKTVYNNINRQIESTVVGLEAVDRLYCLKLRSDLYVDNLGFLGVYEESIRKDNNTSANKFKIFDHRLLANLLFTKYAAIVNDHFVRVPFHLSDWWFFGTSNDVRTYLSSAKKVIEPDYTNYFCRISSKNPFETFERFSSEQYLFISCFGKFFPAVNIQDSSVTHKNVIDSSTSLITNNFDVLDYERSGIYSLKYKKYYPECLLGDIYICLWPNRNKIDNALRDRGYMNYLICSERLKKHEFKYSIASNRLQRIIEAITVHILKIKLYFFRALRRDE